jgi:hypothetical protein
LVAFFPRQPKDTFALERFHESSILP